MPGNPRGLDKSEAQLLAGFANTFAAQNYNKLVVRVVTNSRDDGLEKRKGEI